MRPCRKDLASAERLTMQMTIRAGLSGAEPMILDTIVADQAAFRTWYEQALPRVYRYLRPAFPTAARAYHGQATEGFAARQATNCQ
jgi:hypothetical protein